MSITDTTSAESPITLILEGGGMRFSSFVGALRAIEEKGLTIGKIIGSGTGSLVACLYAAGMSPEEIQQAYMDFQLEKFLDSNPGSLRKGKGLYEGNLIEQWVDEKVNGACFGDSFRFAPQVIATDILNYHPVFFTAESYPEVKLSAAVRYSIGTPWIFTHREVTLKGQEHVLIDGSFMAGAVMKMIEKEGERTLMLKVVSRRSLSSLVPGKLSMRKYFLETLNFSLHSLEKEFIKGGKWRDTILLYCGDTPPAKFNITPMEKKFLFEQGYEQALKYLNYKWGI